METASIIGILNFISRWILFLVVTYRFIKTREKGWALLMFAFFINALDIESYILDPLGIQIKEEVYEIAGMIPNFLISLLIMWGVIHLKNKRAEIRHVIGMGVYVSLVYLWLFFAATPFFDGLPFAIRVLPSSLAFGVSLMYLGIMLRRYIVRKKTIEELFPWGLILLGALNLMYPLIREMAGFVNVAFLLAGVFRVISAIGAVKFAFYPIMPPQRKREKILPKEIYLFTDSKEVEYMFPTLFLENNVIIITRKDPRTFQLGNDSIIYWITRVREGNIEDDPRIFAISPTKIDILVDLVAKGLKQGYNVVYVDAFEYLMLENGFKAAFKFLLSLKDHVISKNGTLILVVKLDALEEKERKLIEREFSKF
ncbi:DUF835 domain-containing protein [Thermococcus sp. SY098]|uniref:DUF835 domain-containing protein n=1 Tax=Thermococcus sp. SY098 TaxID=3111325 RepID=UPI002D797728|nr:DUF835 domain-containing protein [Thermococcus sp. SY098]WRS52884.1 DUF835 domain-containing protein [Thermococcus sp. SY098]